MAIFGGGRLSPIGIDIGARTLKLVQVQFGSDRDYVVAAARHVFAPESDDAPDRTEIVRTALRDILRSGAFKGKSVVVGLNARQLFVQNVRLPRLPEDEMSKVVRWEAEERLPEDFGDAEVRHLVAGQIRGGGGGEGAEAKQEVILLAARRQAVQQMIRLLESVRLRPLAIDIPASALVRAAQLTARRKTDEQNGMLLVDVGAGMTTAVMSRGSEILLIKQLAIGGYSMDHVVARKLNLSLDNASAARQQWGAQSEAMDPDMARAVGEAVRPEIETLAGELLMCIRYHGITFRGSRIGRTVLWGGEANMRLATQLAERIEMPCDMADPLQGVEIAPAAQPAINGGPHGQWALALGLCNRSQQPKKTAA
jgi:type IV pilus assembly protein PilM